jgi:hypothetical protein
MKTNKINKIVMFLEKKTKYIKLKKLIEVYIKLIYKIIINFICLQLLIMKSKLVISFLHR